MKSPVAYADWLPGCVPCNASIGRRNDRPWARIGSHPLGAVARRCYLAANGALSGALLWDEVIATQTCLCMSSGVRSGGPLHSLLAALVELSPVHGDVCQPPQGTSGCSPDSLPWVRDAGRHGRCFPPVFGGCVSSVIAKDEESLCMSALLIWFVILVALHPQDHDGTLPWAGFLCHQAP